VHPEELRYVLYGQNPAINQVELIHVISPRERLSPHGETCSVGGNRKRGVSAVWAIFAEFRSQTLR
jgi:hypothetical protein